MSRPSTSFTLESRHVPAFTEANVRHLLRRTEITDRPERVTHLLGLGSMAACVDDVLAVPSDPPSASFSGLGQDDTWRKGVRLSEFWMDRMASTTRPFGERMAFFWHGHIPSELGKVGSAELMREQIDLWRRDGVNGDVTSLVRDMSIQVAMLRYLDNDRNFANSPNQNFARELMELFVLGVGNYTEADVEAATAAWTGHTAAWNTGVYEFLPPAPPDRWWEAGHDPTPQDFLGRRVNDSGRPYAEAGFETIEVILGTGPLGSGTVPVGPNAGRPTEQVAAEFLSRKLWQEFGEADSRSVPSGVLAAMRSALIDSGFRIRPWVRAMLLHDDFYADATMTGLVRQPVEYAVALMRASGLPAERAASFWLMDRAGQRLLYPPNVSGWKPNGYWVNASAMEARNRMVQGVLWSVGDGTWDRDDGGYIDLPGGRITRDQMENEPIPTWVDRVISATQLEVRPATRAACITHLEHPDVQRWHRLDALMLVLLAPEIHVA
ncbi:MAG: DUF1800 family protein [Actinomycetota bacterium]